MIRNISCKVDELMNLQDEDHSNENPGNYGRENISWKEIFENWGMPSDGTFPFFPEIPEKYSFIHHHKFQEVLAPNYRKFVAENFISESRIVVSEINF